MLIFATLGINILAVVVWSIRNNANGFVEVGKLLRGQPSFIPVPKVVGDASPSGFTGFDQILPSDNLRPTREQVEGWIEDRE
jgi:hypothetical protein